MTQLPSRLRRLDDALAGLPLDDPMLLSELDGFLTGVLVSPGPILPGEWLPVVWGGDAVAGAPFDDPADVRWFADAVTARYNEIARDLARGKPRPILDVDERSGELLWEIWIDGFAQAMELRPEDWAALAGTPAADADPAVGEALSRLSLLVAVARDGSGLDSVELDAVHDAAPADIGDIALRLHASRPRAGAHGPGDARPARIGRNDPCRCGSGRKFKRCCG